MPKLPLQQLTSQFAIYMRAAIPSTAIRHIHFLIIILVVCQMLNVNLFHVGKQGEVRDVFFLWVHISCGVLALMLTPVMVVFYDDPSIVSTVLSLSLR